MYPSYEIKCRDIAHKPQCIFQMKGKNEYLSDLHIREGPKVD